jgi:NNP family nitrate/nitrite transporter-like MFS transporter
MKIFLLLLFWTLWFFNFSSRTILSPLLPLFEEEMGISHTLAGSLSFYLSAGYTLSLLMAGWLAARVGPKKSIAAAAAIFILSLFLLRFGNSYGSIAGISFFMGMGTGLYLPSAVPLLTSVFRPESWGKAFAVHETAPTFAFLSIPLLMALSLRFFGWKDFILVFAGACMIATSAFMIFSPSSPLPSGKGINFAQLFRRRGFWIIAFLWSAASASVMAIFTIMPLVLVHERGMSLESANIILGISRTGALVATFLVGFLVDRYGPRKMLLLSLFLTGASTLWIAMPQPLPFLVIALVLQAAFSLVFFPIGLVAISRMTEPQERSHFTGGVAASSVIFGGGVAPFALGAAGDFWSFQKGILVLGILVMMSSILFVPLRKLEK